MQGSVKPSTIGIILGIIIFFFIANHWMSNEISRPPASNKTAIPVTDIAPGKTTETFSPASEPAQEDQVVEEPLNNTHPIKETDENQTTLEPIYEPPSNSVILVQ
jgi:hypothetical protein